ncbi:MAG: glycosyltransferase family 4 protein [Candidatus Zixiibacteriota bacterium]
MKKNMRILIVTQYFPPERGAVRRLYEFALQFKDKGHDVTVLTAMPNYPDGILPEKYRGKFYQREIIDGLDIRRSYVLPASNAQPKKRMFGFLTFMASSLINSFRIKGKFDLVLASTPPVTSAGLGFLLSKLRRTKFVLEIRDLQPESGEQFGNLKKSIFTETIRRVMKFIYKQADQIVCVTEGIEKAIRQIQPMNGNLTTIKSGVGNDFINSHSNGIRKKHGWEGKFLILFSGTLGWVRPLESIVETARILSDNKQYHFVFVGDGQKKDSLKKLVEQYNLNNVSFVGLQPLQQIPYYLKAGDVLVECLKEVPIAKVALPTKVFEYMAAGRPIAFGALEGETSQMLNQAGGELRFSPQHPEQLAQIIRDLYDKKIDGVTIGKKYHEYVAQNFSREKWADQYLNVLDKVGAK